MKYYIQQAIGKEARKRLKRSIERKRLAERARERFSKRTGKKAQITEPEQSEVLQVERHFDPTYCIRHRRFLAGSIWRKLQSGEYHPKPAHRVQIAKPDGSHRPIDIFSIPDSAVSNVVFKNIIERNQRYFSSYSFAYRNDKTILDAINRIKQASAYSSVYILNYDFSKYFESIDHRYIENILDDRHLFRLSKLERAYMKNVLSYEFIVASGEVAHPLERRQSGVPQGMSISLFLANAAAHRLDLELERRNGNFARYGDDAIVISYSYEDAIRLKEVFDNFSSVSKVKINREKSIGVRILSDTKEEMRSVTSFDFLGYQFSANRIDVSRRKISAWKNTLSRIIYNNLLLYLNDNANLPFNKHRIGGKQFDWDLVQCVNELRRFIYGTNRESDVSGFLDDDLPLRRAEGATGYFCLVEKNDVFAELDGWLVDTLHRGLTKRRKLLISRAISYDVPSHQSLIQGSWYLRETPKLDTSLPSFSRAWRVARKRWLRHGSSGIDRRELDYKKISSNDWNDFE